MTSFLKHMSIILAIILATAVIAFTMPTEEARNKTFDIGYGIADAVGWMMIVDEIVK